MGNEIFEENESVEQINKPFLFLIEDVFSITGRDTVARGTIETGVINVDDKVIIVTKHGKLESVVTGIEMRRKLIDRGEAGEHIGLFLRGVDKQDFGREDTIVLARELHLARQSNNIE